MTTYTDTLNQIAAAKTPAPKGKAIRQLQRKEIAAVIRALLKDLAIKGVSVTAPNYSMAQAVHISLPNTTPDERATHDAAHKIAEDKADAEFKLTRAYMGASKYCPHCQVAREAKDRLEALILAAYPDLDNRSDTQSDHFDYCLSIS